MGNFYTSITFKGPPQDQVAVALKKIGRTAFVSPAVGGCTVVWDRDGDSQDGSHETVAQSLSESLGCPALAVLNHDDDVLMYVLFESGKKTDSFNSCPEYFGEEGAAEPAPGNAEVLCRAFDRSARAAFVLDVLSGDEDAYSFAMERHLALSAALGMPPFVACGFDYIEKGEAPEGLDLTKCVRT